VCVTLKGRFRLSVTPPTVDLAYFVVLQVVMSFSSSIKEMHYFCYQSASHRHEKTVNCLCVWAHMGKQKNYCGQIRLQHEVSSCYTAAHPTQFFSFVCTCLKCLVCVSCSCSLTISPHDSAELTKVDRSVSFNIVTAYTYCYLVLHNEDAVHSAV